MLLIRLLIACGATGTADSEMSALDGRIAELEEALATQAAANAAQATAIASLEDEVASIDGSGSNAEAVWSGEGSGSGICARANVRVRSDRPLYVFATVEASMSGGGGCSTPSACTPTTTFPSFTASTSGSVTINAENSTGEWSDSVTTPVDMTMSYTPYYNVSGSYYYPSGAAYLSHSWTVPVQAVLEIPAPGDYIIDLDVSSVAGTCRLIVLQP